MNEEVQYGDHSVSMRVNINQLIAKMQAPKPDGISFIMRSDGTFTAICKRDQMKLLTGNTTYGDTDLIWHRCPKCERVSFSVRQNLERDAQIAESMGGIFPSECYFMNLPDEIPRPAEWRMI
jgi:hypothetical protein